MIKLITGKKGTGKTKILIDEINEAVNASNGNIATVEKGSTIRYSISRKVRWCDTEYYNVESYETLYGFIAVSGLKMIQSVDLGEDRNLFVVAAILVLGIGGLVFNFGALQVTSVAAALIIGIIVNQILKTKEEKAAAQNK